MKRYKMLISAGVVLSAVVLTVIGWIVLPDTLILQVTFSGEAGTTLPKIAGLAIPFLISAVFAVLYYLYENKKHLAVAVVGLAAFGMTYVMNLK